MDIHNHTIYNKELILRYNKYYLLDFLKKNFLIIAIITLGMSIYMFAIEQWVNGLILIGILIGYFVLTVVIQKITTIRALKRSPIVDNPFTQHYTFNEDYIEIVRTKTHQLKYQEVARIQRNKEFFIIYDINKKTHIIDLSAFDNVTDLDQLITFLQDKIGKRFH